MKYDEKKCPRCAEVIKRDALVCKHCGTEFSATQVAAEKAEASKNGAIGCGVLIALLLGVAMCTSGSESSDPAEKTGTVVEAVPASPAEAQAMEKRNSKQIAALEAEVKKLPATALEKNVRLYSNLVKLAPANAKFVEKRDEYQALVNRAARYVDDPKSALTLTKFSWYKGGFDNVQIVSFTVTNAASFAIKDFELTCTHQGPSGTDMDRNVRTVYELVPANGSKRVRGMNMGIILAQAASSSCEITDAVRT